MIGTYVKRPVEVQAVRWDGTNAAEIIDFVGYHSGDDGTDRLGFLPYGFGWAGGKPHNQPMLWVEANEAWLPVQVGSFVIKDRLGCYPCDPGAFYETYKKVPHE